MEYRCIIKDICLKFVLVVCFLYCSLLYAGGTSPGTITVTDAVGDTVRLNKPAKRIVIVGRAPYIPLHMLYLFPEARQVLAGYERKTKSEDPFLSIIDPDYRKKSVLEANPGPEHIAALNPDLVITKETVSGALARSMKVLGIPLMHIGVENPDRSLKDIALFGRVLNNEKRAAEIIDYYTSKLDFVRNSLKEVPPEKRPRVLTLEYSNRGGSIAVKVPARSWIQTIQAQSAGGMPVWVDHAQQQDGWQVVGFEQIAAWNPDKIFIVVWYRLNGPEVIRTLKNDDKWKMLKAVSNNEFYLFPEDIFGWDTPDPRWILGLLWLAKKINPGRFVDMNIKQEVYDFFRLLYGLDKKTVNTHIMPRLVLDAAE